MVVTKVGETFVMSPNAVSANGEVKYTWLYRDETSQSYEYKVLGNDPTLTLTKKEIEYDDYNMEQVECFVEDGNEQVWISFVAFTLTPDAVELIWEDSNAVEVGINGSVEELTNNILRDDLHEIGFDRQIASIKLTADGQDRVSAEQQAIVSESLNEDTKVGTMIDMNLYKKVGSGEETRVTELSAPIELTVAVDDELVNTDTTVERTYEVVRVHDGKVETIDCEFDAISQKITFETDRFSTYAIVYKDTIEKEDPVTEPDITVGADISKDIPVGNVSDIENIYETVVKENNKGYTADDKAIVEAGGSAKFYLSAKPIEEVTEGTKAIDKKVKEDGYTRGTLIDLSVFKAITPLGGNTTTTKLVELPSFIAVTIDIPEKEQGMKSYVIYRYHDGVDVISTTKNADGEYIELSKDGKQLTLHIKKFSEYAIGYLTVESGTEPEDTKPADTQPTETKPVETVMPVSPKTGDNADLFVLMVLALASAIGMLVGISSKKKA